MILLYKSLCTSEVWHYVLWFRIKVHIKKTSMSLETWAKWKFLINFGWKNNQFYYNKLPIFLTYFNIYKYFSIILIYIFNILFSCYFPHPSIHFGVILGNVQ